MPGAVHHTADVFGVSRDLPLSYVERDSVDNKLIDNLTRDKHVIIYGGSKQGKTCLRKHCLNDNDYVLVQCQNTRDIAKLSEAIQGNWPVSKRVNASGRGDNDPRLIEPLRMPPLPTATPERARDLTDSRGKLSTHWPR